MKINNIDIQKFLDKFNKNYDFLYDNFDNVSGYSEALIEGDEFISNHINFITEFNKFRGDILSSDREVVAFMFTLDDMCD